MIGVANDRTIGVEEARVLTAMAPDAILGRAAFAGQPFHIKDERRRTDQPRTLFPEAVVLALIDAGWLFATQQTAPWVERGLPARPFSVGLTKDGEQQRIRLLRRLVTPEAA